MTGTHGPARHELVGEALAALLDARGRGRIEQIEGVMGAYAGLAQGIDQLPRHEVQLELTGAPERHEQREQRRIGEREHEDRAAHALPSRSAASAASSASAITSCSAHSPTLTSP